MATEIIFPRVDMDMSEGRFSRWLVEEGAAVAKGAPLFEIETDKAAMEIEAPAAGTLHGLAKDGDQVKVGAPVGWLVAEGEAWTAPGRVVPEPEAQVASAEPAVAEPEAVAAAPEAVDTGLRATPLARREARSKNIDLGRVQGSGPRGRIVAGDLATAVAPAPVATPAAPQPPVREPAPARSPDASGLHRQWTGTGTGTPLVFLHGFGADLSGWRPLWRGLEANHRILGIDLPGHGRSEAGPEATFAALVDQVRSVLHREQVEGCVLIGHSLGGAVALGLVETGAVNIRALGLISPAGLGPDIDGAFLSGLTRATRPDSLAPWLRRLVADPAMITDGFVRATLSGRSEASAAFQQQLAEALFPDGTQAISLRHVLPGLTMPTRVIWGVADRIIPATHGNGLPGQVGLHRVEAGHMPHLESPLLLATLIAELARSAAG